MLGISEQNAKMYKTGFAKIGHTAVSKPQLVGFQVKKLVVSNLKVGEKILFSYPCLGFFHQNHPFLWFIMSEGVTIWGELK